MKSKSIFAGTIVICLLVLTGTPGVAAPPASQPAGAPSIQEIAAMMAAGHYTDALPPLKRKPSDESAV